MLIYRGYKLTPEATLHGGGNVENATSRVELIKKPIKKGHPENVSRCPTLQIKLSLSRLTLMLHQSQCTRIADKQHDCHGGVGLAGQTD